MSKDKSDKTGREQRLASALRDNLRRRKAASRPQDPVGTADDVVTDGTSLPPKAVQKGSEGPDSA